VQLTDRLTHSDLAHRGGHQCRGAAQAKGVDIADFGPGEPDFPTPDHHQKAAIKAIEENRSKYTPTADHAAARSDCGMGTSASLAPTTRGKKVW